MGKAMLEGLHLVKFTVELWSGLWMWLNGHFLFDLVLGFFLLILVGVWPDIKKYFPILPRTTHERLRDIEAQLPTVIKQVQSLAMYKVGQIQFVDPGNPLGRRDRWTAAPDNADPCFPDFSGTEDIPGGLRIKVEQRFAMDYKSCPSDCEELRYLAQCSDSSVVYVHIEVVSSDHQTRDVWIAYVPRSSQPRPYDDGVNEWTIGRVGDPYENGWRYFTLTLREDVAHTFGTMTGAWSYQRLLGIRLRGSISISPVEFYATSRNP